MIPFKGSCRSLGTFPNKILDRSPQLWQLPLNDPKFQNGPFSTRFRKFLIEMSPFRIFGLKLDMIEKTCYQVFEPKLGDNICKSHDLNLLNMRFSDISGNFLYLESRLRNAVMIKSYCKSNSPVLIPKKSNIKMYRTNGSSSK